MGRQLADGMLPASAPAAASAKQSHDKKQQDRTESCINDCADHPGAQMDANFRQRPVADKGTHYPDKDVANDPEAGSSHDLAGQPARDEPDEQYDQQAFVRHMHWPSPI